MGKNYAFVSMAEVAMATFSVMFLFTGTVQGQWLNDARATFYGDPSGRETKKLAACGYDENSGYGVNNAALSTALFNDGLTCGACYEIQCINSPACHLRKTITITATNFCPPNYSKTVDVWCNPPQKHFDLSQPMFLQIAEYKAGVVPVQYRRVPCVRRGGIKFNLKGNDNFFLVLVYNVAGAGDVNGVQIKVGNGRFSDMTHNWGQNWQFSGNARNQVLSFIVRTSDGKTVESDDVAPANWQFGQTFEGKQF